jgi:hypothetical protein
MLITISIELKKEILIFLNKTLNESLENFLGYLKGLKNKFLEDLILNKISMVEDPNTRENLLSDYAQKSVLNNSTLSSQK